MRVAEIRDSAGAKSIQCFNKLFQLFYRVNITDSLSLRSQAQAQLLLLSLTWMRLMARTGDLDALYDYYW